MDGKQNLELLLAGELNSVCLRRSDSARGEPDDASASLGQVAVPPLVFPGSFDPVHKGHRKMAEEASGVTGVPVAFELSVINVDKPTLQLDELLVRVRGLLTTTSVGHVWVTRAATFLEKSALFPASQFVVGADTLLRIGDPKYYASQPAMLAELAEIAERGCRFLVFARQFDGTYQRLVDLPIPDELRRLCRTTEVDFRVDISSTELRDGRQPQ